MKKLIPADTVDSKGVVWETTGENIRNGAKEFSENDIQAIADILFPVGSVYCGENAFILSTGKWENITKTVSFPVYVAKPPETYSSVASIRMWKRVS